MLAASRALVAVAARSIAGLDSDVTLPAVSRARGPAMVTSLLTFVEAAGEQADEAWIAR